MKEKIDIMSLTINELTQYVIELGEKSYRARQIYEWLHNKLVDSFEDMSNLPKSLMQLLDEQCFITTLVVEGQLASSENETIKYLFKLKDDHVIESVFMKYKHGYSVCITSQVGCRMGCKFCASAIGGLNRDLSASEMLEQVYAIQKLSGKRISNVVVMGIGEPLENYDSLIRFIKVLSSQEGLHISQRNIAVSTCGLIDKILALADERLKITLAISLHAPNNKIRVQIMPVAHRYSYQTLIEACKTYVKKTNRRITFEYILIKDINDSEACAQELSCVLSNILCHVNLIPMNPIEERSYEQSPKKAVTAFKDILVSHGIQATVRRELGQDIDAACGQLRRKHSQGRQYESVRSNP